MGLPTTWPTSATPAQPAFAGPHQERPATSVHLALARWSVMQRRVPAYAEPVPRSAANETGPWRFDPYEDLAAAAR
jgi:hypothetical protein